MATIYIRRDRLRATAKVWLENYPATPTWTSRYSGTTWKPGDFNGRTEHARVRFPDNFLASYDYSGTAWVAVEQSGSTLTLESPYDVHCFDRCLPDIKIHGSSKCLMDTVFNTDGPASLVLSGSTVSPEYGSTRFVLYDWTAGTVIARNDFGDFDLTTGHVYRFRWQAELQGIGDPMPPPLVQISFRDSVIAIPGAPEAAVPEAPQLTI